MWEQIDEGLVDRFSMEDAINVRPSMKVDGILLRPTDEKVSEEMIDKACSLADSGDPPCRECPGLHGGGLCGINDYFPWDRNSGNGCAGETGRWEYPAGDPCCSRGRGVYRRSAGTGSARDFRIRTAAGSALISVGLSGMIRVAHNAE